MGKSCLHLCSHLIRLGNQCVFELFFPFSLFTKTLRSWRCWDLTRAICMCVISFCPGFNPAGSPSTNLMYKYSRRTLGQRAEQWVLMIGGRIQTLEKKHEGEDLLHLRRRRVLEVQVQIVWQIQGMVRSCTNFTPTSHWHHLVSPHHLRRYSVGVDALLSICHPADPWFNKFLSLDLTRISVSELTCCQLPHL